MSLSPFFNRVGSKRAYVSRLAKYCPTHFDAERNTYFEPFLGTGSLLLYLQPKKAVISDIDTTIAQAFSCMKTASRQVKNFLTTLYKTTDFSATYEVLCKEFRRLSPIRQTAALIFISKHSYGSILKLSVDGTRILNHWRGQSRGMNWRNFHKVAAYLGQPSIQVAQQSFQDAVRKANKGDFIFLDPPYNKVRKASARYYQQDHISVNDLTKTMNSLHGKGCFVLMINCFDNDISHVLPNYQKHIFTGTEKFLGAKVTRQETVYTNYPVERI